jgi:hypothetical protein
MCDLTARTETIFYFTSETESLGLELKLKVRLKVRSVDGRYNGALFVRHVFATAVTYFSFH